MNFGQMKDRVYEFMRDAPAEFIRGDEVGNWLNEGARMLARRAKVLRGEVTGTVVNNAIALPTGFIQVDTLHFGDELMYPQTPAYFDEGWFRIFGNEIEFKNVGDGTEYTLRYYRDPVDMAEPEDISEIPVELHEKIVWYAISTGLYKEREDDLATEYMARFEDNLPAPTNAHFRDRPGPLDMAYVTGPFDKDASHRG